MRCLAIDPGSEMNAWVVLNSETMSIEHHEESDNRDLTYTLSNYDQFRVSKVVIENLMLHPPKGKNKQSAGFYVGKTVRDTLVWIGTFRGAAAQQYGFDNIFLLERQQEFRYLLGKPTGTDAELRRAIMDRYGGKEKAIGGIKCGWCHGKGWKHRSHDPCQECKATGWAFSPGPLHGLHDHEWQALAVALTWVDMQKEAEHA